MKKAVCFIVMILVYYIFVDQEIVLSQAIKLLWQAQLIHG